MMGEPERKAFLTPSAELEKVNLSLSFDSDG